MASNRNTKQLSLEIRLHLASLFRKKFSNPILSHSLLKALPSHIAIGPNRQQILSLFLSGELIANSFFVAQTHWEVGGAFRKW